MGTEPAPFPLIPLFDHVEIVEGPASVTPDLVELAPDLHAASDVIVWRTDAVSFRIEGTERVIVEIHDRAQVERLGLLRSLFYGFIPRCLLAHARRFSVHGSLVRFGEVGIVVAGHRGAGKSTTVTHLADAHRAQVLIDDVVPFDLTDGAIHARPYSRPVHLLPDAARRLGVSIDENTQTVGGGEFLKYSLPNEITSDPIRVHGLVFIDRAAPDEQPAGAELRLMARRPDGGDRLRLVVRSSNSTGLASFGERAPAFLEWAVAVADALPMLEITRATDQDTLDQVGELVAEFAGELSAREPSR